MTTPLSKITRRAFVSPRCIAFPHCTSHFSCQRDEDGSFQWTSAFCVKDELINQRKQKKKKKINKGTVSGPTTSTDCFKFDSEERLQSIDVKLVQISRQICLNLSLRLMLHSGSFCQISWLHKTDHMHRLSTAGGREEARLCPQALITSRHSQSSSSGSAKVVFFF